MSIQPVGKISFKANVKINRGEIGELVSAATSAIPGTASGIASTGSIGASSVAGTASQIAGSTFDVLGTAFSAKASGVNSSGIVPSAVNSASPYLTPGTVASSNNHPSVMGTIMSVIANFFHGTNVNVKKQVKRPN